MADRHCPFAGCHDATHAVNVGQHFFKIYIMEDNKSELMAIWVAAIDVAFPNCKLSEKLGKVASAMEYVSNVLEENGNNKSPITLNGKPITQQDFDTIYKGYKDIEVAKIYVKNYRETLLKVIHKHPDMVMPLIELLLNIKK